MNRLEQLRRERGMSREALARAAATTRVSIYRYEAGIRTPDLYAAQRLAKALGCSLDELVADPEDSVAETG